MKATIKINVGRSNDEVFEFETPNFEGSEKQIAFATDIFVDVISGLCNMVAGKMSNEKVKAQYDMIMSKLSSQTSAKFWIDNRGNNFQTIYKSL
jgi:hypothetical protein